MAGKTISKILLKLFGSRNERLVRGYRHIALETGRFEEEIKSLSEEALKAKTAEFKNRLTVGESPQQILPEAFAVVRETARRNVNMRHFDVQLIGGNVLYDGKIAEMATGEGKTLVATLAAYMVHLTGRKVHIVTVNDYLAKRDAEWMGPIYKALGLSVGAIQADMDTGGDERKAQYGCDVTYGTNNEFGFDYLRDNMKLHKEYLAQGPLEYAIIDEVDSILIDEARTPLIISGPAFDDISRYKKADTVARQIINMQGNYDRIKSQIDSLQRQAANAEGELSEAKRAKDESRIEKARQVVEKARSQTESLQPQLETAKQYYEVEYDHKQVRFDHEGNGLAAAQELAGVGSFFAGANMDWPHLLQQSLRAHIVFEKEKDYVVMDGKVVIVDEFTGRLMHGRQWSDGLHQAVEAKENVQIKEESQTLATITLQNFFRLYDQIAGMTGTAATEADEFMQIYKLEVVTIPTNKPCIRKDDNDLIYKSMNAKFNAIAEEIHNVSSAGRPVLVGTISVEKSEAISNALTKKFGIEHEVLNAKQHTREAHIVEMAGQQHNDRHGNSCGNVTIATNMAGRGTDIKLGPGVADIGGLHILGTERHESRRIDNQLRGRSGRQGDAGSSQFFLCFDDDLLKIFSPDWTVKALSWVGWEEGMPIQHGRISKGIEKAQKKVEQRNFESRKSLLDFDEVMDYQRKIFYSRRRQIIEGTGLKEMITEMIKSVLEKACIDMLSEGYPYVSIAQWARNIFGVDVNPKRFVSQTAEQIEEHIKKQAKNEAANNISVTLGEYLEDYEDKSTWNIEALCKWAMSAHSVQLSGGKLRQMTAEEIEQTLIDSSAQQIDKKDCVILAEFLDPDFGIKSFANWAANKFAIKLDANSLKTIKSEQIQDELFSRIQTRYAAREIEYPVEFAMSITYRGDNVNIYAFESLAKWTKDKFGAELSTSYLQNTSPRDVHSHLMKICQDYHKTGLEKEIDEKLADSPESLAEWTNERFHTNLKTDDLTISEPGAACPSEAFGEGGTATGVKETLLAAGRNFLRSELTELERYVLLQIFDSVWKDHLYAMDHLKESIFMRAYAEKDPKIEYKQEGFRMFSEMLDSVEDKVTDIIFKVRLESGAKTRNVWQAGQTRHEEVSQFEMAERQRAAAQAPQGEATKVKQIKLAQPKTGRNDPCPCGSGKKYKKCCGKNA